MDGLMERVWEDYRQNFRRLSIYIILVVLLSFLVMYAGYALRGTVDGVTMLLTSAFLMAGVYAASRWCVEEYDTFLGVKIMVRYVLALSLLMLLVSVAFLLPYPVSQIFMIVVMSVFFVAVPVVAEMGIWEGLRKVWELVRKRPVSVVGLNWLFFMFLLAISSLRVSISIVPEVFMDEFHAMFAMKISKVSIG